MPCAKFGPDLLKTVAVNKEQRTERQTHTHRDFMILYYIRLLAVATRREPDVKFHSIHVGKS